tara:strand:- start:60963 stop:62045 length:1083 start_codon:yes stop_codon:yes gene_type:complete
MKQKTVETNPKTTKDQTFYVGTYTQKESKGIYKYSLSDTGVLKKIGLVASTENPSFLALSHDQKSLIAVNEIAEENGGFVSSYAIKNDRLIFMNKALSGGDNPCFVGISKNGNVLVANYSSGTVGLLKLEEGGTLSELLAIQQHTGKGITERQEAPHAHSVWFEKNSEQKIIAVDLGSNELWFSEIDTSANSFLPATQKLAMAAGAGPRHLAFHPNENNMYVLNELDNTITLVKKIKGMYANTSTISTVPHDFSGFSKSADIHVSKDGKFLYASNRGHDSLAIFSIHPNDGSLQLVGFERTKIKTPRNFSLSPDNKFLLVANQDADTIIAFSRDSNTGLLRFVSEIQAPTPVCILFTAQS